ncbi:MAG: hypothetical protein LBU39_04460 [Desulfobulbaceae bacterium]|jgi:urease accessory protein|nr:hypothetical protein [Desulfobulbaceae bacterium]
MSANCPISLLRLLQLVSPTLPVGAFSSSQGLEWAVEQGWAHDEASAHLWISGLLRHSTATLEAPLIAAVMAAHDHIDEVRRFNAEFLASRESAELRAECLRMGYSLARLASELPELANIDGIATPEFAYPTVWALIAAAWDIEIATAVPAYLFSCCENQVTAAVKLIPLGQSAGQRILSDLARQIPALVANTAPESAWNALAPGQAIASCRHESQYCRLFRS